MILKMFLGAVLTFSLFPIRPEAATARPVLDIKAPFDQELFELSYSVFLANGNPIDALAVARRAIQARPSDRLWKKKAAQSAEWSGQPSLALEYWQALARSGDRDREAEDQTLRLSRALGDYPVRYLFLKKKVTREKTGPDLHKEYLEVSEIMGLPREAYDLLAENSIPGIDPVWRFTEQARLAELLGMPEAATTAWKKRAALKPLEPEESLNLASLWYGQGDTVNAFDTMKQGTARAPESATVFWDTYRSLAYALGKTSEAGRASKILISSGSAGVPDYQLMLDIHSESDPARAYGYALEGWRRFTEPFFWHALSDTGLRSGHARDLIVFMETLTPEENHILNRDARSWMARSQVYRTVGRNHDSLDSARQAVQLAPFDPEIYSAYLWLLIDMKRIDELRHQVRTQEGRIDLKRPELREPLAAALLMLGDAPRALYHYRILAPQKQNDPAWLATFADVLEQAGEIEAAWQERRRAFFLLRHQITEKTVSPTSALSLSTQVRLLISLSQGDDLSALIRGIAGSPPTESSHELIIGWAMATGQSDLARLWYWNHFARAVSGPEWAKLGLALEENDRTAMGDLLDTRLDVLPYRDAIEAARRTGWTPLAQQHAFDRLELNSGDHLTAAMVRQLFQSRPGYLNAGVTFQDLSGVGWIESRLALSQPLTHRFSLLAEAVEHQYTLLDGTPLVNLPGHDTSLSLALTRLHHGGHLALKLGLRDSLDKPSAEGSLTGFWQPGHGLNLEAVLDYHGRAEETAALAVGGRRDRLRLTASGSLTRRDTLGLELSAGRFHDENREYLGQMRSVQVDYRHQLTHDWPDSGMRLFCGVSDYDADGTVGPTLANLIPQAVDPSPAFFIPRSFGQVGFGLFAGQANRNSLTRTWLPFADLSLQWNSRSGTGFNYRLGAGGSVTGLDRLVLEIAQGTGEFGKNDLSTTFGVSYRYLF